MGTGRMGESPPRAFSKVAEVFWKPNTEALNEYYLLIADQQCKPLLKYSESLNTEQNDIARPSVQEKVK